MVCNDEKMGEDAQQTSLFMPGLSATAAASTNNCLRTRLSMRCSIYPLPMVNRLEKLKLHTEDYL
jgi:hypothetical protein